MDGLNRRQVDLAHCNCATLPLVEVSARRHGALEPCRTRSRISAAAASLKVIAANRSIWSLPEATSSTARPTSAVVLPVPAPASTKNVLSNSRSSRSRVS
jgi:hypothetical protein